MLVFQTANLKVYVMFKKVTRMFLSDGDSSLLPRLPHTAIMKESLVSYLTRAVM